MKLNTVRIPVRVKTLLFLETLRTKFGHCPTFKFTKNRYSSELFGHFPNFSMLTRDSVLLSLRNGQIKHFLNSF